MEYSNPIPFDDWVEPFYAFIDVDGKKIFVALDEDSFIWADATDPIAEEIIIDLIVNSLWTPYSIMGLCEDEDITYGIIYMRIMLK